MAKKKREEKESRVKQAVADAKYIKRREELPSWLEERLRDKEKR